MPDSIFLLQQLLHVLLTFDLSDEADMLEVAVEDVLAKGLRTADLGQAEGGQAVSTSGMGDAIVDALAARV